MKTRFYLLSVAVSLLALAAPALANAATGLTKSNALIPTGYIITFKNIGTMSVKSAKFSGSCGSEVLTAEDELTVNTASEVKTTARTNVFDTTCLNSSGGPIAVRNLKLIELKTTGFGKGTAIMSFEVEPAPEFVCKYYGSGGFIYDNTALGGGSLVYFDKFPLTVSPSACGPTAELSGQFNTTTKAAPTYSVYLM